MAEAPVPPAPAAGAPIGAGSVLLALLAIGSAFLPFDMATSVLWLVVWVATLFAFSGLASSRATGVPAGWRAQPGRYLVIGSTLLATVLAIASQELADGFARDSAREAAAVCARDGACPALPAGWERASERAGLTARYPLRYSRSEDGQSFQIGVEHNLDNAFFVYGDASGAVTERHWDRDAELAAEAAAGD